MIYKKYPKMENQTHYIIRIGDGKNFINSSKYNCWGMNSKSTTIKHFIKNVKENDILWFVKNKSKGNLIGIARYIKNEKRIIGPLICLTETNEELGWNDINNIDYLLYYDNLYNISDCNIFINILGPSSIFTYIDDKYNIDLKKEYQNIIKYSKITKFFIQ